MTDTPYSKIDSSAAIALVLSKSARAGSQGPYVRDVSRVLFTLREKGFRFRDLGLRKIPGGYYSEDVETFVGQLLSMGYATQRSPIRLETKGEELCRSIVREHSAKNKDEIEKLERTLDEILQVASA